MKKNSSFSGATTKTSSIFPTLLLFAGFGGVASLKAAIYTYEIKNVPSVQVGASLTGNISIDTAFGSEDLPGNFFIGHSSIVAWNFTVTPSGGTPIYSGSSTGINPSSTGSGGNFAMYATPTSLSLIQAASLKLESDFVVPGADVSLLWVYDTPIYNAGGTGVGGATWFNFDRTALDAAFPANPDASANNWTIATAVPEPSLTAFLTLAGLGCCVTRRRIKF